MPRLTPTWDKRLLRVDAFDVTAAAEPVATARHPVHRTRETRRGSAQRFPAARPRRSRRAAGVPQLGVASAGRFREGPRVPCSRRSRQERLAASRRWREAARTRSQRASIASNSGQQGQRVRTTTDARADGVGSLPRTLRFLIATAEPAARAADQPLAMTSAEWAQLPAAAHRHGLSALLHDAVSWTDAPASDQGDECCRGARSHCARAPRAVRSSSRQPACFQHAGIRSVCLKGPVLSEWLYGTAGFRRFFRLDVLVAPRDLTAAYHLPRASRLSTAGRHGRQHGSIDLPGPGRVAPVARGALSAGPSLPVSPRQLHAGVDRRRGD